MRTIFIWIFIILLHGNSMAQKKRQKEDWFTLGYGMGYKYLAKDLSGQNFGGAYYFNNYKNFYYRGGVDLTYNPGYRRSLYNFNAGIGKQIRNKMMTFNVNAGPSFFFGRLNSNVTMLTLGLTATTGLYINILPDMGLGIELFTNANFIQSTHGFRISIIGMQPVR